MRTRNRCCLILALLHYTSAFLLPAPPRPSTRQPIAASHQQAEGQGSKTLLSFLGETGCDGDLLLTVAAISTAVKRISYEVRRASLSAKTGVAVADSGAALTNIGGDQQKKLDVVANDLMKEALISCGRVSVLASEEEDGAVVVEGAKSNLCVVYDPLDGSSNVDAAIPTGTIFGVYRSVTEATPTAEEALRSVLQPGRAQVASGYCLFSAQTLLVLTVGKGTGTHIFTLDPHVGEFVLLKRRVSIPRRGSSYSLNEARSEDWPEGLRRYITDLKRGEGQSKTPYDLVYVCSLVADVHWVMVRGGWASNPRSHLRLVYEGNPMALVVEEAGGLASTGTEAILDVEPTKVHQRLPIFVGSHDDILELETYDKLGGVQQLGEKKYAV